MDSHPLSAYFLVGPTAVGKTAAAQRLAEESNYDILSADSMLVYKGMDIATAKPEADKQASVRYWGMDLTTPDAPLSAGSYRAAALDALRRTKSHDRTVLVSGGSGLYIKVLTHGLDTPAPPPPEVRQRLQQALRSESPTRLEQVLKKEAPQLYDGLSDKQNSRRLVRAVEMALVGARTSPDSWQAAGKGPSVVGLVMPMHLLRDRVRKRVIQMYESGLVSEVEELLSQGFGATQPVANGIGYTEAIDFIKGRCSRETAIERTSSRTCRYAKRQMTWFRHQTNVNWIHIDDHTPIGSVLRAIRALWRKHGPTPIAE